MCGKNQKLLFIKIKRDILYLLKQKVEGKNKMSRFALFGAIWGLCGVCLLLGYGIYRMFPIAVETFDYSLSWYHWLALHINTIFMAYCKGYRGFQNNFSPRTSARARYLRNHPQKARVIFAPFFCMGYFQANRKRKIITFSATFAIVLLGLLIRYLNQPWRGILDIGVVVGLIWGVVSLIWFGIKALVSRSYEVSPEVSS